MNTRQMPALAVPQEPEESISREEYKDLVNTYDSPSDLWEQPRPLPPPQHRPPANHVPLAPRLVIQPSEEAKPPHTPRIIIPPDNAEDAQRIRKLEHLLATNLPGRCRRRIWEKYCRLPRPHPRYLTDQTISLLFRHLAWVEFKDLESSQRYFTLLDDCLASGVEVSANEWNTAIAFAGRWLRFTTTAEVKSAVEVWMRMEDAGAKPTNVTFNILFDVAARAGRFALADMIFKELRAREMEVNRFLRVSMIHYAGLKGDGEAVRRAFRESGEAASAENVVIRMKTLHAAKFEGGKEIPSAPRTWQERKRLGHRLDRTARELRREQQKHESSFFGSHFSTEKHKEAAQHLAPIHPDAQTCRILIRHHCLTTGNLDRVRELIQETRALPAGRVHGSVYMYIFRGFWLWGGHAYTAWNRRSLENFWEEFLQAASFEEFERALREAKARDAEAVHRPGDDDFSPNQARESSSSSAQDSSPFRPSSSPPSPEEAGSDDEDDEEDLLPHEHRPPFFTPRLAERVLYAFYKCAGAKKMRQVWTQIQARWADMSEDDHARVKEHVDRLGTDDGRYDGP
ncbi:hypothetical protein LTR37_008021 [Vermiconidia calcicola]|uniref:Uncharacterized protein n=1 Tax=Vermiconidia calcicola TaxID=1690605 RepID=A0ACC3NC32_9PEZI|nr:hypothetical protein LTR37_008021 [Vermiconidia calcicola]